MLNSTSKDDTTHASDTGYTRERRQFTGLMGALAKGTHYKSPREYPLPTDTETLARLAAQVDPDGTLSLVDTAIRVSYAWRLELLRAKRAA